MIALKVKFEAAELRALRESFGGAGAEEAKLEIATRAYTLWREFASNELTTSRNAYLRSLEPPKVVGRQVKFELVGGLANLIEHGTSGFDLRKTLLRPGEEWRVIPFQHASPSAKGTAGAQPIGRPYKAEFTSAKTLRTYANRVYKAAKQLGEGESLPPNTGGMFPLRDHHKTDLYAGMIRQQLGSKVKYTTFRTITRDGPGWEYPATLGRHFAQRVVDEMPKIVQGVITDFISGIKGKK